jgi:putative ABC transport system permease protein
MMIFENVRTAMTGLVSNKLRTLLSILGILIGVMSVTLLLAVGTGAAKMVDKQVADLGSGVIYVFPRSASSSNQTRRPAITREDVTALETSPQARSVRRVAPMIYSVGGTATVGAKSFKPGNVIGTDHNWFSVFARPAATGITFNRSDVLARRRVALIGRTVSKRLFAGQNPIGRSIRLNGNEFQIIGVLQVRGGGLQGDQDSWIVMPYTAMNDTLRGTFESFDDVAVQARPGTPKGVMAGEIASVLAAQHRITDPAKYDWETFDNAQLAQVTQTISIAFRGLLGLIAGISLLVGGIGVMNIMLVTVTERTREIGIRKALGARRSNLLGQFLIESIVLTGVGGTLGMALGVALSRIRIGAAQAVFEPWMGGLALGVSVFIGIVFGVYPANRAARLRPIDALRYE